MTVVNLFCLLDFSAFIIARFTFLYYVFALQLDGLFVIRNFAIHIHFHFLVFPYYHSLYSWGRAASSERMIGIIMCMFLG